jgi:AcrR family transcriptional regulator
MTDEPARTYQSPLRDEQARRTRNLILDALVELLADRRADDITTREIANRAGVSQPTVYRHFADRTALLQGISARIGDLMNMPDGIPVVGSIDEVGPSIEVLFVASDEFAVEVRAEVLLNADPRRYSPETQRRSAEFLDLVAAAFPDLDERRHAQVAGLLRCVGSSQSWLRMREEFGVPGVESGPLARWAIDTLIAAVRDGQLPDIDPVPRPDGDQP